MSSTYWLALGLVLLILELISPQFYSLFFGLGALLVALFLFLGLEGNIATEVVLFLSLSLMTLYFFRKKMLQILFSTKGGYLEFEGQDARVVGHEGGNRYKVYYRGAEWKALSYNSEIFDENEVVQIESVDGIVLKIIKKRGR